MATKIFVNLPVKDLNKTKDFFAKLGFTFNPQFTDKNAACMVIGEDIFAMLLVEDFFKTFIKKQIADSSKYTEAIVALNVESRQKVDAMMEKALKAGATEYRPTEEQGGMYGRSFQDLDGHLWEIGYMDESKIQKPQAEPKAKAKAKKEIR